MKHREKKRKALKCMIERKRPTVYDRKEETKHMYMICLTRMNRKKRKENTSSATR
jgi:hypothetical protein